MCDPTVIAGTGLLLNVLGGQQQSAAQAGQAQFEASVAATNAANAERMAADTLEAGHDAELRQLRRVRALTGRQRVSYAGANVDMSSGTPLDVIAESAGEGAADASRIRSNAIREAWGYKTQAGMERDRARYLRGAASDVNKAGLLTGAGSLLGGGYQIYRGR